MANVSVRYGGQIFLDWRPKKFEYNILFPSFALLGSGGSLSPIPDQSTPVLSKKVLERSFCRRFESRCCACGVPEGGGKCSLVDEGRG